MIYQEGYVYHIKDEYFEKVHDSRLMQNKENGTYRPTFYCLRDKKTSLLWMVPLSTRVEKFRRFMINRYKNMADASLLFLVNLMGVKLHFSFRICFQSGSTIWIIYIPAITIPYQ